MINLLRLRRSLHIVAAGALLCAAATASTITVTGFDTSRGESIWLNLDGSDEDLDFAGALFITLRTGSNSYNRTTYCVDVFTNIYVGQTYNTTVVSPSDIPGRNLNRVAWLIDNYAANINTAAQGAGFQLALWDIVHDNGDGFASGRVRQGSGVHSTPANVLEWAQTFEALSLGNASNNAFIYKNTDISSGRQVQTLAGPRFNDGGPAPAPEPSTFVLMGIAMIVLGRVGLRKKNQAGKI